jgi:hypothetical protein
MQSQHVSSNNIVRVVSSNERLGASLIDECFGLVSPLTGYRDWIFFGGSDGEEEG